MVSVAVTGADAETGAHEDGDGGERDDAPDATTASEGDDDAGDSDAVS